VKSSFDVVTCYCTGEEALGIELFLQGLNRIIVYNPITDEVCLIPNDEIGTRLDLVYLIEPFSEVNV
jgi:hypothetical protein